MEQNDNLSLAGQMIGLTRCAVNGEIPGAELCTLSDPDGLFRLCQRHSLTACAAYALESAGVRLSAFTEAKEKAIRKNILLDAERKKILSRLETAGIWYLPLKGALLKDWYPRLGMRQMSDNDILFEPARRADVRQIMESLGFTCEHYGSGYNDAYAKQPVSYFEMHCALTSKAKTPELFAYYEDVARLLLPDPASEYGRQMRDEDFCIFVTVHAYKHFTSGGTGIRSLLDDYIMRRHFGDSLDRDYMRSEMKKLGVLEYAERSGSLAEKLFTGQPLDSKEEQLLQRFLCAGTYGTKETAVRQQIEKAGNSRLRYVLRRIFPSMEYVRLYYPFYAKHPLLMPVLWITRPFRALFRRRDALSAELRTLLRRK